jgi:hypothetical protein
MDDLSSYDFLPLPAMRMALPEIPVRGDTGSYRQRPFQRKTVIAVNLTTSS